MNCKGEDNCINPSCNFHDTGVCAQIDNCTNFFCLNRHSIKRISPCTAELEIGTHCEKQECNRLHVAKNMVILNLHDERIFHWMADKLPHLRNYKSLLEIKYFNNRKYLTINVEAAPKFESILSLSYYKKLSFHPPISSDLRMKIQKFVFREKANVFISFDDGTGTGYSTVFTFFAFLKKYEGIFEQILVWLNEESMNNQWINSSSIMNWRKEEIESLEMIQPKIQKVKLKLQSNNNNKIKQEFPQNSFESWNEVDAFLNEKLKQINSKMNGKQDIQLQNFQTIEKELKDIENEIQRLQSRKKEIEENLLSKAKQSQRPFEEIFEEMESYKKTLEEMCFDVSIFCKNENEMNEEIVTLYSQKKFEEFDCLDISKLLWKMDLTKYQQVFEDNQINGLTVSAMDDDRFWEQFGVEKRDCFHISFHFEMMKSAGYSKTFSPNYEDDCCVCSHNTPKKTVHLLQEYDIPIEDDIILKNNYCSSILTCKIFLKDILGKDFCSQKGIQILIKLDEWKKSHKRHLKDLKKVK